MALARRVWFKGFISYRYWDYLPILAKVLVTLKRLFFSYGRGKSNHIERIFLYDSDLSHLRTIQGLVMDGACSFLCPSMKASWMVLAWLSILRLSIVKMLWNLFIVGHLKSGAYLGVPPFLLESSLKGLVERRNSSFIKVLHAIWAPIVFVTRYVLIACLAYL